MKPSEKWLDGVLVMPSGCWEHEGKIRDNGYRRVTTNGKYVYSHRFMYAWIVGKIPEGQQIDHLCRNRGCVNPFHMETVTQRENILRGESPPAQNARKTHCARGHLFTEETTRYNNYGRRFCGVCVPPRKPAAPKKPTGGPWQDRTHCKNGHEFTPENTRINKYGRRCKRCHRERMRQYAAEGRLSD